MNVQKVLIKILDEDTEKIVWAHVCYVKKDLYLKFLDTFGIGRLEVADFLSKWAKEDFSQDLTMTLKRDLKILKSLVMDKYSRLCPTIYNNNMIDIHGWMRVWMTEKMEKELKKLGK